jgi:hypothetical protein
MPLRLFPRATPEKKPKDRVKAPRAADKTPEPETGCGEPPKTRARRFPYVWVRDDAYAAAPRFFSVRNDFFK